MSGKLGSQHSTYRRQSNDLYEGRDLSVGNRPLREAGPARVLLRIRRAERSESDVIAEILRVAFSEFESDYTPLAFVEVTPKADEIAKRFATGATWIAELNGEPVGTVWAVPDPEHLMIRSMAVLPRAQGNGVAQRLLETAEAYAVESGFENLFLYVTDFSTDAIRLYERNGWVKTGVTTAEEWHGTPGLTMEKELNRGTKENAVGS